MVRNQPRSTEIEGWTKKALETIIAAFLAELSIPAGGHQFGILEASIARHLESGVASPTSQLILQPFRRFTYITAHSTTLPLLHLRHKHFIYVTWRAAHGIQWFIH